MQVVVECPGKHASCEAEYIPVWSKGLEALAMLAGVREAQVSTPTRAMSSWAIQAPCPGYGPEIGCFLV